MVRGGGSIPPPRTTTARAVAVEGRNGMRYSFLQVSGTGDQLQSYLGFGAQVIARLQYRDDRTSVDRYVALVQDDWARGVAGRSTHERASLRKGARHTRSCRGRGRLLRRTRQPRLVRRQLVRVRRYRSTARCIRSTGRKAKRRIASAVVTMTTTYHVDSMSFNGQRRQRT